jgi:SpoVK/Ycf46/Vps4 family AAA+-type ATPase
MATNRIETLDPALLRPGRIDRKIEFPLPDSKTKRRIFNIHVSRMSLADDVNLEEFVMSKDELSGADIKAMCTEAGLLALRERRMKVRCVVQSTQDAWWQTQSLRERARIYVRVCLLACRRSRKRISRRPRTRRVAVRVCIAPAAAESLAHKLRSSSLAGAVQEAGGCSRGTLPLTGRQPGALGLPSWRTHTRHALRSSLQCFRRTKAL